MRVTYILVVAGLFVSLMVSMHTNRKTTNALVEIYHRSLCDDGNKEACARMRR